MKVTKEIEIEDLVNELPEAVGYLREEGIRCLRCGEPIWGHLKMLQKKKATRIKKLRGLLKI